MRGRFDVIAACAFGAVAGVVTAWLTASLPTGRAVAAACLAASLAYLGGLYAFDVLSGWWRIHSYRAEILDEPARVRVLEDRESPDAFWQEVQSWR